MTDLKIAVLGGGLMGAGIAQIFAAAGYSVTVFEPSEDVRSSLEARTVENLKMVGGDTNAVDRIKTVADLASAVSDADYVTEAAPEKIDLKRSIFADLERLAPRHAILASNTSVIPITKIVSGLETTDRMLGNHWWNPPYLVPLVEVIQTEWTSPETIATSMALLKGIGKEPAHLKKDTTGFVGNRLQHALWREAIAMIAEGICDPQTLDACVKNSFGLRSAVIGPLENADLIGLDLTLDIHSTMMPELDQHNYPHELLQENVDAGKLGFKSGEGFRTWSETEMQDLRKALIDHLVKSQS